MLGGASLLLHVVCVDHALASSRTLYSIVRNKVKREEYHVFYVIFVRFSDPLGLGKRV